ncbi:MAG: M20/M25/M40 family metallo-hydrolase [Crocinitomicaceae bacterium]|jgi:acetylornithine deacetylase|nr:M20/M25/M40 family metallo-hydrolase [Crocinitomicaceae bacterium]
MKELKKKAVELLAALIETPSFSKHEEKTAELIETFIRSFGHFPSREGNNIWVVNKGFNPNKKTLLLNSHHDTVKPNLGYTRDPFKCSIEGDKIFGLGSNDAGASLVSLLCTFHHLSEKEMPFNLVFLASAEEEISGKNGVEMVLKRLPEIHLGIIGEPTEMNLAIAEKGLLVIDAVAIGKAGHAAHPNLENSIYMAMRDIHWISKYEFPIASPFLGKVHMTVSQISAGEKHNQVPAETLFTIDVRIPESYTLEQVFQTIDEHTESNLQARSFRLKPSSLNPEHELVKAGQALGMEVFGSPTLSDQALMPFPTVKLGPGNSERSHAADEYVHLSEIEEGIEKYIRLIEKYATDEIVG